MIGPAIRRSKAEPASRFPNQPACTIIRPLWNSILKGNTRTARIRFWPASSRHDPFNVLGAEPPIVAFAPGDRDDGSPKDTALNIRLTREFVINLVDEAIAEPMNLCAASLPYGENELLRAGLTTAPSTSVKPPRIAEAPASLECTEWGTLQIGGNRVVIGLVKRVHVRDELFDAEKLRVRADKLFLIGRMAAPHWYCRTRDRFEMIRPA